MAVLDLLAEGVPVDAARLAAVTGEPEAAVIARFAHARTAGYEFDDAGRLVGAALTLRPTRHRFRVRGNDRHAWCGFDTLFLPILLDEPARATSTCPASGTAIELQVAAQLARAYAGRAT